MVVSVADQKERQHYAPELRLREHAQEPHQRPAHELVLGLLRRVISADHQFCRKVMF